MPDYLVVDPSDAHNICYTTKDKSEARRRAEGGLKAYGPLADEKDLCKRVFDWNRSHTGLMPIMPGSELEVVRKILEMMGGAE